MNTKFLLAIATAVAVPAFAQLAPMNDRGITVGHVHLNVSNIDVQETFWKELGATPINDEKLLPQRILQFKGIYVMLREQTPTGPSDGSVINHFGFHVKNINDWIPKWKAEGITIEPGKRPTQMFLIGPDGVRVEIIEDASIAGPIEMHHIHLFVTDPLATQAWYVKNFGAVAGKRAQFDTATLPGAEITISKVDMAQAGSEGRSLDHFGVEVKDLDQFVKALEASGTKIDGPIRASKNTPGVRSTYVTDPWGTRIELTEGSPRLTGYSH
jgi:catechol 2,3-dioxygenase-like lactoylglutathione lyase family enzyme